MREIYEVFVDKWSGNYQQLHTVLLFTAIGVSVLIGILLYRFYKIGKQLQEDAFAEKIMESVEDSMRRGKYFNYQKMQKWLKSIGAEYSIPGFGDPFRFVMTNLLLVVAIISLCGLFGKFLPGIGLAVLVVMTEIFMLVAIDQKQNKEMLNDISFLYDATSIQLTSHIYVAQAVANCLVYIKNQRLKKALMELCSNITLGGDIRSATKDFSEKFHNEYLDTFCNVIVQITAETGEAGRLIEDMSKQLSVLKETNFASRKKATENKLQLCIIGIFLMFTVVIFFLCIASMTGSTNVLF